MSNLPEIVAKLKASGHRTKYIAFVLYDRKSMTRKDIAEMLGVSQHTVATDIWRIGKIIQGENTRTERLWQGCDAAFVGYEKQEQR